MTAFLGNTPKVLDNYLSKIWTGGAKLLRSVSQYVFGLFQECEIFSKKWVGEASSLLTTHQSDYFLKESIFPITDSSASGKGKTDDGWGPPMHRGKFRAISEKFGPELQEAVLTTSPT